MRNTVLIVLISLLFFGCSKDKFSTTPSLKLESISTKELQPDQIIRFELRYTDAEGDLQDSIYIEKVTLNCAASNFKNLKPLPEFPTVKNESGVIEISYANGINLLPDYIPIGDPKCGTNDTCYMRFMLKDKAQHKSDTINSPVFVVIKR